LCLFLLQFLEFVLTSILRYICSSFRWGYKNGTSQFNIHLERSEICAVSILISAAVLRIFVHFIVKVSVFAVNVRRAGEMLASPNPKFAVKMMSTPLSLILETKFLTFMNSFPRSISLLPSL